MRSLGIALVLLVLLNACRLSSPTPASTPIPNHIPTSTPVQKPAPRFSGYTALADTQQVVENMKALYGEDDWYSYLSAAEYQSEEAEDNGEPLDTGALFLESLEAEGEKFDPNEYFTVLSHLAPEDGYVLDYVYFAPGGDGAPYVYARPEGEQPLATFSEYENAGPEDYLNHVQTDGSAEGYFELALLSVMGEQFYLAWHFAYNDWEVVSSHERLEEIIDMLNEDYAPLTEEQVEEIMQLDVSPKVKFTWNKVQVRTLVFTKYSGFYERIFTFDRDFPHQMNHKDIELIPYNSGVMF